MEDNSCTSKKCDHASNFVTAHLTAGVTVTERLPSAYSYCEGGSVSGCELGSMRVFGRPAHR